MPFDAKVALSVFVGSFLLDILWTLGIRRAMQGNALQSALFSGSITLVGGFVITEYVGNHWYLLPSALGALVGNYVSVKIDSLRKGVIKRRLRKMGIHV